MSESFLFEGCTLKRRDSFHPPVVQPAIHLLTLWHNKISSRTSKPRLKAINNSQRSCICSRPTIIDELGSISVAASDAFFVRGIISLGCNNFTSGQIPVLWSKVKWSVSSPGLVTSVRHSVSKRPVVILRAKPYLEPSLNSPTRTSVKWLLATLFR